jgi:hypothetical protein
VVLRRNRHQHAVEREEEEFFAVVLAPSVYDRMYTARLPQYVRDGAVAGWGSHPLESAALSRRTPGTDVPAYGLTFK